MALEVRTDPHDIRMALERALCLSQTWARQQVASNRITISNSDRSARFLSDTVECLNALFQTTFPSTTLVPRYISVDDDAKRGAGEWLLDATWTEDAVADKRVPKRFPIRLRCALECESGTAAAAFFRDFTKLIVVSSDIKIFAAGLNQKTLNGTTEYMNRRVCEVKQLLDQVSDRADSSEWYLAFWPSPMNVGRISLWSHLDHGRWSHLSHVTLFHRSGNIFNRVEGTQYKF